MKWERKRKNRLARIIDTVQQRSAVAIRDLAREFGVSEATIRRDLAILASDGMLSVVHAAAVLDPSARQSGWSRYSLAEAGTVRMAEKLRIGQAAAALVRPGEVIIVDSGSTTECLARSLPQEIELTVICFALNILVELRRHRGCRLVIAGGELRENTLMFDSPQGVELIGRYRSHLAFISASGVSDRLGVTCANHYEVACKQAAIRSSLRRVLLADSSKFGRVQPAYFADLDEFDTVITDSGLPEEHREIIARTGAELIVV